MGALEEGDELEKGWKGAGRGLVRTGRQIGRDSTEAQMVGATMGAIMGGVARCCSPRAQQG